MPRPKRIEDRLDPRAFSPLPDPADFEEHERNQKRRLKLETRGLTLIEKWFDGLEERFDLLMGQLQKNPHDNKVAHSFERLTSNVGGALKSLAPLRQMRPLKGAGPLVPLNERETLQKAIDEVNNLSPASREAFRAALGEERTEELSQIETAEEVPEPV